MMRFFDFEVFCFPVRTAAFRFLAAGFLAAVDFPEVRLVTGFFPAIFLVLAAVFAVLAVRFAVLAVVFAALALRLAALPVVLTALAAAFTVLAAVFTALTFFLGFTFFLIF